jgi:hypothetical protein
VTREDEKHCKKEERKELTEETHDRHVLVLKETNCKKSTFSAPWILHLLPWDGPDAIITGLTQNGHVIPDQAIWDRQSGIFSKLTATPKKIPHLGI